MKPIAVSMGGADAARVVKMVATPGDFKRD
jgi:hypothetical protein